MNRIERYILAVTEGLPEDIRYDVADELRSNIEDMLPDNANDNDIKNVLEKLGNPKKLAQDYYPTKRYLIGPALYDSYFNVLRTVIGIAVAVIICITLLEWIVQGPVITDQKEIWTIMFADMIDSILSGALQAGFWVTLIFALMEKSGVNEGKLPFIKKKWTIDDLPSEQVSKKAKIPVTGSVISMFFTILFTVFIYLKPQLIGIYIRQAGRTEITPVFNIERLKFYTYAILILAIIKLSVEIWKLIQRKWTYPLATANMLENIATSILLILMFNDRLLINPDIFEKLGAAMKVSAAQLTDNWVHGSMIISIVFITAICIGDSIASFYKCKK